ncbi:uncharacterized protein [Elaeis guineensis]|uniref:Uncharacterized protein LOC109505851 n=1 Tax=Elaeis guineensis var. tenera TaxID=51953 RepID=A0A6J0PIX2_ELAGV|nr:uncharacterized protein LOC109505851 [Elaeis guineensis]
MDLSKVQDIREGITCSSHEPDAVLIEFVDDEEDSYIDLNLDQETSESDEFEFQISLPSQSSSKFCYQSPADELFHDGQIVPLKNIYGVNRESSQAPNARASFSAAYNSMDILTVELLRCRELSPDNYGASGDHRRLAGEFNEEEPTQFRKHSKIMWLLNGGMMKFLIKFPPEKFRLSFISTMKSYCSFYHPANRGSNYIKQKKSPRHWKLVLPSYKWTLPWKSRGSQNSNNIDNKTNNTHNQHARKLMISDINDAEKLDAFDALSSNLGRGSPNFGVYPTSILQSPYHTNVREKGVMEMDRSINAAIDHCKVSLGSYQRQR